MASERGCVELIMHFNLSSREVLVVRGLQRPALEVCYSDSDKDTGFGVIVT